MRSINFKGLPAYAVLYGGTCYSAINTSCQQAIFLILSTIKHVFLRITLNENKSSSWRAAQKGGAVLGMEERK